MSKVKLTKEWFEKFDPCTRGVKWFLSKFDYGADGITVLRVLIAEDKLND